MTERAAAPRRFLWEHVSTLVLVALLSAVLHVSQSLTFLDHFFYDSLLQASSSEPHADVVIVGIDEFSLRHIGRWPWDRKVHAEILNQLTDMGARAVLMDIIFAEADTRRPDSDIALTQAIAANGHVYLPVHVEQLNAGGQLIEVLPHAPFAQAAAGLGHVDLVLDRDGVARSVYMRAGIGHAWWPHITQTLLLNEGALNADPFPIDPHATVTGLGNVRQYHRFIPYVGGADTYPQISAADVWEGRVPAALIRNKIVLIGATAAGMGDMLPTPTASQGEQMAGVEINANLLDGLRGERLIRDMPAHFALLLTLALALLVPLVLPFVLPRWGIPVAACVVLIILVLSASLLALWQIWFAPGAAVIGAFLSYPLWTWRRLEYSLGYMRHALARLAEYSALNRRLTRPAAFDDMARMLNDVLPVSRWRLSGGGKHWEGEEPAAEASKHEASAVSQDVERGRMRRYRFSSGGVRYTLEIVWQDAPQADQYDGWLRAMLVRVGQRDERADGRYEVLEKQIAQLREEENRQEALTRFFQSTLAQIGDGVVIADACGVIVYANDRAAELLDVPRVRLDSDQAAMVALGHELTLQEHSWAELLRLALLEGRIREECRNRLGHDLYLDMQCVDAGDTLGSMLIVSLKDISAVKSALRSRSEMLDFLSHDLRSPMVSVLALTERMRQSQMVKQNDRSEWQPFLDNVEHYAQRNLNIAEQFLQLARVEAIENVELSAQDMLAVVESGLELVSAQAQQRDITLRFEYDHEQDVWVMGYHEWLERLMVNLLTNAIKYSHPGGSVDVRLTADAQWVSCQVRDRGVGIPAEFLPSLFQRFSRASTSGGAATRGAGMGLRFVKVVTERHGGDIEVQSQVNEGSCFTLKLPRIDMD